MIPVALNTSYLTTALNAVTSVTKKTQTSFQQLMQSLQAGDLPCAQHAYAALTTQNTTASQPSPANATAVKNPLSADLNAVGQALQSGDLAGAQKAFAKLQQDAQAAAVAPGHHHHHRMMPPTIGDAPGSAVPPGSLLNAAKVDVTA